MPDPDMITVREAAALLKVDIKWWRRRTSPAATIPCPVTVYRFDGHVRLSRSEVEAYMRACATPPATSKPPAPLGISA